MNFDIRTLPLRDIIIGGILFVVVSNLVYLDIHVATQVVQPAPVASVTTNIPIAASSTPTPTTEQVTPAPAANPCATCPAQINMAMSMIQNIQRALTVTPTLSPIPNITITPTPQSTASGNSTFVKEYYIPMGIGYSQAATWADVSGVQAKIDTTLYPPIKQVTLEFTGYTPTGNQTVYARLYNDTDSHAIDGSEVTWSGGGYQSFVTSPLTLDSGNKTYSIQIQTQLQYVSYIEAARLHVILY